jgi:hypothetical protein
VANNRLYLYDPDTKLYTMIAKHLGGGWYLSGDTAQRLHEFFEALKHEVSENAGFGGCCEPTGLRLMTESENFPEGARKPPELEVPE